MYFGSPLDFPYPKSSILYNMISGIIETLTHIRNNLTAENLEEYYINFHPEHAAQQTALPESHHAFTAFESHKYYEMAIQLDRHSRLQIGQRCYILSKNQFCIIPCEQRHRLQWGAFSEQSANMLWVSITGEIVRTSYTVYSDSGRSKVWGSDLHIPGNFIIGEILAEQSAPRAGSTEAIVSYLQAFFSLLLQKLNFDGESSGHTWTNAVVSELQEYIKAHLNGGVTLQDLSGYISLSPNYLCKLFKQVTGETITHYIQNLKITRSIEYLADPSIPLSKIAEELGFYDQFHFSKVFKTYTCMSPSQYRNTLASADIRTDAKADGDPEQPAGRISGSSEGGDPELPDRQAR